MNEANLVQKRFVNKINIFQDKKLIISKHRFMKRPKSVFELLN
jgi:hypothetical protein